MRLLPTHFHDEPIYYLTKTLNPWTLESLNPGLNRTSPQFPHHLLHPAEQLAGLDHKVNFFDILAESSISLNGWDLSSYDVVGFFDPDPRSKRKQKLQTLSRAEQFHC